MAHIQFWNKDTRLWKDNTHLWNLAGHQPDLKWNTANILWNDNYQLWCLVEEVIEVIEVIDEIVEVEQHGGRSTSNRVKNKNAWEEKKKKVIQLVMYRKNIKIYDEEKEVKNIKYHIKDIKLIAKELKRHVQIIY
jgi:hypothetical protein